MGKNLLAEGKEREQLATDTDLKSLVLELQDYELPNDVEDDPGPPIPLLNVLLARFKQYMSDEDIPAVLAARGFPTTRCHGHCGGSLKKLSLFYLDSQV